MSKFTPSLIIFDKDGTLIHFDAMWGGWVTQLAERLEAFSGRPVAGAVYAAMGFDRLTGRVDARGRLAVMPMTLLRALTVDVLQEIGLPAGAAEAAVAASWNAPDPVALARPFTDLVILFGALRARGKKIAIATTDDRAPTEATLAGLGVAALVDALVCADDGVRVKPAPDMVLALCRAAGVPPAQAVVIGDSTADLQMGRAAGAGLIVGVLSGVSLAEVLQPYADMILATVAELPGAIG